ncbi:MAG: pyridoxal-phosphate dependent enzyme [Gammaproteobacteria bacterium]|nr:pyridoxal-phosphate dependent enzyme [Gammaproteobacteria bacterium]
MIALEEKFPALHRKLPRTELTHLPTPLLPAPELSAQLKQSLADLDIKQDGLCHALYGGNKVRKLEYLLGEAIAQGCDSVITFGAIGSNHVLATAVHARQLGLDCYGVLTDQPATPYTSATLRYHALLGTHLQLASGYQESLQIAEAIKAKHASGPDKVFQIPWGGSSWLGATGFVNAGLELAKQSPHQHTRIYIACGTMGTVAGLALGLQLANMKTRIEAVRVVPEPVTSQQGLERLCREINRELHDRDASLPIIDNPLSSVTLRHEFFGPGYAETTTEAIEAVNMALPDQLALETTYTGKAMAALIADARAGLLQDQSVIFWNTYNAAPYPVDVASVSTRHLAAEFGRYLNS